MDDDNVNIEDDDDEDDDDEDIEDDAGEDGKNEDDDTLPRLQVPTVAFACKPLTSIIEMILLLVVGDLKPLLAPVLC